MEEEEEEYKRKATKVHEANIRVLVRGKEGRYYLYSLLVCVTIACSWCQPMH
jgi:hypothetical protein